MDQVPQSVLNPGLLCLKTVKNFRFHTGTEFLSQPLDCHSQDGRFGIYKRQEHLTLCLVHGEITNACRIVLAGSEKKWHFFVNTLLDENMLDIQKILNLKSM